MSVPKRRRSNINLHLRIVVRSDRCDPEMEVLFANGHKAVFKTQYLPTANILSEFNRLCELHNQHKSDQPAIN